MVIKSDSSKKNKPPVQFYFQSVIVREKHGLRQEKYLHDNDAVVLWENRTTLYIGAKAQYRISARKHKAEDADFDDPDDDDAAAPRPSGITVSMKSEEDDGDDMVIQTPTHIYELYEPIILDEGEKKKWLQFQHRVLAMDPHNNNNNDNKRRDRSSSTMNKSAAHRMASSSSSLVGREPRARARGVATSSGKMKKQQQQMNSIFSNNNNNHQHPIPIRRGRAYGRRQAFASPFSALGSSSAAAAAREQRRSILPSDDENDIFNNNNNNNSNNQDKKNKFLDTHDDEPAEQFDDDHAASMQPDDDEKEFSSFPLGKKRASPTVFSDDDDAESSDTEKQQPPPQRFKNKNKNNNNKARGGNNRTKKRLRTTSVLNGDDDDDEVFDADDERASTRPSPDQPSPPPPPPPPTTETADAEETAATGAAAAAVVNKKSGGSKNTQGTLLNFFRIKNPNKSTAIASHAVTTNTTTMTPRLSISDGQEHNKSGASATPGTTRCSTSAAASSSGSRHNPSSSSCATPPRRRNNNNNNNAATTTTIRATTPPQTTSGSNGGRIPVTARKSSQQRKKSSSNISSATWLSQDQYEDNCHDHFSNDDDDENDPFKLKKRRPTNDDNVEEDALQEFPSSPPQKAAFGTTTSTSKKKQPLDLLDSVPQQLKFQRSNQSSFLDPTRGGIMRGRLHPRGGKDYGTNRIVGSNIRRAAPTRRSILSRHHDEFVKSPIKSSWSDDNCFGDPSKTPVFNRNNNWNNRNPYTTRTGLFPKNDNDSPTASSGAVLVPNPCRGLKNLGNTCYMNASLQMLYTLKDFCGSLTSLWQAAEQVEVAAATTSTATTGLVDGSTTSSSASTTLPLTKSVKHVYKLLQVSTTRNKRPVHPGAVKNAMDALTEKFVGYEQRDAHEFLSDLIDFLHEEHLKAKKTIFAGAAHSAPVAPAPTPQDSVHDSGESSGTTNNDFDDNVSSDGANGNKENDIERGNEQQPGVDNKTTAVTSLAENKQEKNDAATAHMTVDATTEETLQSTVVASSSSTACPEDDDDDFRLTCEVGLKCLSCGYFRKKKEIYRHLSLDIIAPVTHDTETSTESSNGKGINSNKKAATTITPCSLGASLKHFFQPEIREINCEKCANGTHASQSLRIVKRPKALLLHLKRFIVVEKPQPVVDDNSSHKAGGGDENAHPNSPSRRHSRPVEYEFQKNKAPVEIAERLSLANFLSTSEETEESSLSAGEYKIQSIVHHIGSRASSGHYTADALRLSIDLPAQDDDDDVKDADDKNKEEGNINKEGDQHDKSGTPNTKKVGASLDSGAAESKAIPDKEENSEEQSLSAASAHGQEQEEWISFDDTNSGRNTIANITGSNFKQRTAYMLLYKFSPAAASSTGATPTAPLQESCKVSDDLAPPAKPAPMELVD